MGVGTGHGAYLDFLSLFRYKSAAETDTELINNPLGTGVSVANQDTGVQRGNTTGRYLIRNIRLHTEEATLPDIRHLDQSAYGTSIDPHFGYPDFIRPGTFSFDVLMDTIVQRVYRPDEDDEDGSTLLGWFNDILPRFVTHTQNYGPGGSPLRLVEGTRVNIVFPTRDTDDPAASRSYSGSLRGSASVISRNFGTLQTNATVLGTVTMQWIDYPNWLGERWNELPP